MTRPLRTFIAIAAGSIVLAAMTALAGQAAVAGAVTQVNGAGSSYDAPLIESFIQTVSVAPYSLNVSYSSTSSGDGRYEFANQVQNFGATDIQYGLGPTDTTPPSFPYLYVPIVAAGIAFMYNIPGLTQTLRLDSYTACALLTGGITNWDNPAIASLNPGVSLPELPVVAVTESDPTGNNFGLEAWCIAEQPALWAAFADQQLDQQGGPTDGVAISPTSPNPDWPGIPGGLDVYSSVSVAAGVVDTAGAVGAVFTKYGGGFGFGGSNTAKNFASVENASGDFTQPTSLGVTSALAYATQASNGSANLDFNGLGPNVYNPSTYTYLVVKTTQSDPAIGAPISAFVNYALTLGQETARSFGYGTLGLPLENFGVNEVAASVPGAVPLTAAEQTAYDCGDLTPADVAAGLTTPSCSPGTGTPEAPYALALPLLAFALISGTIWIGRSRRAPRT
jgi:phosphate transport system substrate-binding protein